MANGILTMMMKVLCQKNRANGLKTAIKTHAAELAKIVGPDRQNNSQSD
jgi:hypothetical protein